MSFTIRLRDVVTAAFWLLGVKIALANFFVSQHLGALSMVFLVAGATLVIVGRIDKHARDWETAYGAGREVSKVRRIR